MSAIKLLPFVFLFTGLVTLIDRGLNGEIQRLSDIRGHFMSAVHQAKVNVTSSSWAVLSDPQIQQNLELGNVNTVGQSLQVYLKPGEVSQLHVVDGECNLIAKIPQNGKPIADLCQAIKSGKAELIWHLNEQNEASLVSIASKSIGGKNLFVASEIIFDREWISLHPRLYSLFVNRDISMTLGSRGGLLWKEGRLSDGRYALPLSVEGVIYRFIPVLTGLSLRPMKDSFWLMYGLLGLFVGISLWQVSARFRKDRQERLMMVQWIQECQMTKNKTSDAIVSAWSWSQIVDSAKQLIAAKDLNIAKQLHLMKDRLERSSVRLRERELEISDYEQKISKMSDLSSLQEQLQHTTASFLRQMEQMRETCETIYDVATCGLVEQAKSLKLFYAEWHEGLSQPGNKDMAARKFFRSLVETQGRRPGLSKLDDQMNDLEVITMTTLDQSLNAAMLAQQALSDCEGAAKLAGLWHGIAMRDAKIKTHQWAKCLIDAQKLIGVDDKFKTVTFEVLPEMSSPESLYPAATQSALVSGFFHLYLAILHSVDVSQLTMPLVVRQKKSKDQASIILAIPSKTPGLDLESPNRLTIYHVELAKQILSAFQIKVSILPGLAAGFPVGLTWSIPQKQAEEALNQEESEVESQIHLRE